MALGWTLVYPEDAMVHTPSLRSPSPQPSSDQKQRRFRENPLALFLVVSWFKKAGSIQVTTSSGQDLL